jgi:hypothetical protein
MKRKRTFIVDVYMGEGIEGEREASSSFDIKQVEQ